MSSIITDPDGAIPTEEQMAAAAFLSEYYGVAEIDGGHVNMPGGPLTTNEGSLRIRGMLAFAFGASDMEVARWMVAPDGRVLGAYDPDHLVEQYNRVRAYSNGSRDAMADVIAALEAFASGRDIDAGLIIGDIPGPLLNEAIDAIRRAFPAAADKVRR